MINNDTLHFIKVCSEGNEYNRWTPKRAREWYQAQGWRVGVNFIPSNAENTLEMWQGETYNLDNAIDRELKWLSNIRMNAVRVFLHYLVWQQNPLQFLERLDNFLNICDKYGIKAVLVMFDDCWDPFPRSGLQLPPIPFVHNSRWAQNPGWKILSNVTLHKPLLKRYLQSVIAQFADDDRVLMWDLYNEPGGVNARK